MNALLALMGLAGLLSADAAGLTLRGTVADSGGKAVAGARVGIASAAPRVGQALFCPFCYRDCAKTTRTDDQGRFAIHGLDPTLKFRVLVSSPQKKARLTGLIDPLQGEVSRTLWKDVEIRLKPGVVLIGRVLHQGQPRAGVVVKLVYTLGEQNRCFPGGWTKMDARGVYRIEGLEPGDRYRLEIHDPDSLMDPRWMYRLRTVPGNQTEIHLPDINLLTHGQTLRGVVVDPRGKPVPGITVYAHLADGRPVPRLQLGPPPRTTTDSQGRFELRQLPDEPIELMAFRANPRGGHIRYPSEVRPALNQQDIRIVFDPNLDEPSEDLDAPKR